MDSDTSFNAGNKVQGTCWSKRKDDADADARAFVPILSFPEVLRKDRSFTGRYWKYLIIVY